MAESKKTQEASSRYLTFTIGTQAYGIPLLSAKEVIAIPKITPIPFSPPYFLGYINIREKLIGVIDLRSKFSLKANQSAENAIIVCDLGQYSIGIIVDAVNSVLLANPSDIAPKSEIQSYKMQEYLLGIHHKGKDLILLLDIARLLTSEDYKAIESIAQEKAVA